MNALPQASDGAAQNRRVNIQDVAREAGVSVSAVSKVLRDAYGVSPAMRTKVTAAIDSLGYRPHAGARGMRGRSYTLGMVTRELSSPLQAEIAGAFGLALDGTSYQGILIATDINMGSQRRAIEALLDRQVDGLMLIAPWMPHEAIDVFARRTPLVAIARTGEPDSYDTICDDGRTGSRLMVDHLAELGHTRIAHITAGSGGFVAPHVLSHVARREAYESRMRELGLTPHVVTATFDEKGGYEAAQQLLDADEPPSAIYAGADIAALGVLRAAKERGLSVPDELTVTGFDNAFISSVTGVELTTIDQSALEAGTVAARLLLERLNGRTEAVHHLTEARLVVRRTSGPPPT